MPLWRLLPTGQVGGPFNSLFEMLLNAVLTAFGQNAQTFNSLFEMRRRGGAEGGGDRVLSILYLRCPAWHRQILRRQVLCQKVFQFSI